jgi:kynurenine formamidase
MSDFMNRRQFNTAGLAVAGLAALGNSGFAQAAPAPDLTEQEIEKLAEELSNWGRWGKDDEQGTLNFITNKNRVAAARLVKSGRSVNISHRTSRETAQLQLVFMQVNSLEATDMISISNHGPFNTHIDAIGHMFYKGKLYNGRDANEVVHSNGLEWGGVRAMKDGIVTRAVFLDVAKARGVPYLAVEEGVVAADLDAAERLAGVKVGSGDAVIVRVGNQARAKATGQREAYDPRPGMLPETLRWLHARDIALWAGDCADRNPNPYKNYPWPFHILSEAVMGMPLLHFIDCERLAAVCQEEKRYEFMLTVAPLHIEEATGSPVSPLAIF